MTTPQQRPETVESTERAGSSAENVDSAAASGPSADAVDSAAASGPSADASEATAHTRPSEEAKQAAHSSTTGTESSARRTSPPANGSLFAEHEVSGLVSRWADVQAAFVDDPRECVQKADALVADLVDRLTTGFAEARSRLEEQWARGEEVSTENLRVTLKRYRDFFDRLLAL